VNAAQGVPNSAAAGQGHGQHQFVRLRRTHEAATGVSVPDHRLASRAARQGSAESQADSQCEREQGEQRNESHRPISRHAKPNSDRSKACQHEQRRRRRPPPPKARRRIESESSVNQVRHYGLERR